MENSKQNWELCCCPTTDGFVEITLSKGEFCEGLWLASTWEELNLHLLDATAKWRELRELETDEISPDAIRKETTPFDRLIGLTAANIRSIAGYEANTKSYSPNTDLRLNALEYISDCAEKEIKALEGISRSCGVGEIKTETILTT